MGNQRKLEIDAMAADHASGKLTIGQLFRFVNPTDLEMDYLMIRLAVERLKTGHDKNLKKLAHHVDFLEDERRRCYRELEEHEVEIERLKDKIEQLMNELNGYVWDEMRSSAMSRKNRRKFNYR